MKIKFKINPTKTQKKAYEVLHDKDTQFLIARWSRQCGKTVFSELCLIEYLCKPNTFNAYISPTYSQGRKVYKELVNLLDNTGIITKANASTLTIETKFKSTFQAFSMDSPNSIRGYTVSGILVMDEAAFFPVELSDGQDPFYNVILPIIKARKPKVLVISTPNGRQGMFYNLYMKAFEGYNGYREITATIYDDELISKEDIEQLKKGYPPLAWKAEFEVEFLANSLTVFPNFENCFDISSYTNTPKCWIGIDPSTVGEDNTILTIVNEKMEIRQHKIDGGLDDKYEQIASLINKYNPQTTYIEDNSIGVVMYNEIKKRLNKKDRFKTFHTDNDSKKQYISLLAVAIDNNNIHFEQNNKLLYSELSTFSYKLTKTGTVTYAARDGYHDDTVTSLGIALQCKKDTDGKSNRQLFTIIRT